MKKIFIVFLFFMTFSIVNAEENNDIRVQYIPRVYYNYVDNGVIHWGQMNYVYVNEKLVYCMDVTKLLASSDYIAKEVEESDKELLLMAYFGYGYSNNVSVDYYLATQQMIWEKLGYNVYYTTAREGQGNIISVKKYKNQILDYLDEYKNNIVLSTPFNFNLGDKKFIQTEEDELSEYNIINDSDNVINVVDNTIYFEANESGNNDFILIKSYPDNGYNKIFYAEDAQNLLYVGNVEPKSVNYSYVINSGKLVINLYDKYNDSSYGFKDNIFYLYDSNSNLLGIYETGVNGKLSISDLKIGSYKLEHVSTNDKYTINRLSYEFEIKDTALNKAFGIYLSPKEITFSIKKTYGNPTLGTIYYDSGVAFDVYDSKGNKVNCIITDESGEATLDLIYDEYKIIQENINLVRKKANDYTVRLNDFNGGNFYNIYTPVYDSSLKIYLYESGSNIPIKNAIFNIDDKEYSTGEIGYFIVDNLIEGEHNIVEQDVEGYISNNDITFNLDENCNFYLENGSSMVDLVLYNEKLEIQEPVEIVKEENASTPENIKESNDNDEKIITEEVDNHESPKEEIISAIDVNDNSNLMEENKNIERLPNLYAYFFEKNSEECFKF